MSAHTGADTVRLRWADGLEEERRLSVSAAHARWIVTRRWHLGPESVLRRIGSRWIEDISCAYVAGQLIQSTGDPMD